MEISKKHLEMARRAYVSQVLEWGHQQQPETEEYIFAMEKILQEYEHHLRAFNKLPPETPLCPHPRSKESFMQVSDGNLESATATVDDNGLLVRKDLTEPLTTNGAGRVEIQREPEPLIDTPSMENREKLSGADRKEAGSSHGQDSKGNHYSFEYLRKTLSEIALEHDHNIVHQYDDANYDKMESTVMKAVRDVRLSVLYDYLHDVLKALK